MNESEKAQKIIHENVYAVLATASKNGSPWVSPVFFAFDDQYNIYWVSNKDAQHSQLLKENPQVAISIFNSQAPEGEGDAVYIKASVTELSEVPDIELGTKVFNERATQEDFKISDISKVSNEGVWRIYRATPQEVWKLGKGRVINGQYVDERIPVSL